MWLRQCSSSTPGTSCYFFRQDPTVSNFKSWPSSQWFQQPFSEWYALYIQPMNCTVLDCSWNYSQHCQQSVSSICFSTNCVFELWVLHCPTWPPSWPCFFSSFSASSGENYIKLQGSSGPLDFCTIGPTSSGCWCCEIRSFLNSILGMWDLGVESALCEVVVIGWWPLQASVAAHIQVGNGLCAGSMEQRCLLELTWWLQSHLLLTFCILQFIDKELAIYFQCRPMTSLLRWLSCL